MDEGERESQGFPSAFWLYLLLAQCGRLAQGLVVRTRSVECDVRHSSKGQDGDRAKSLKI